MPDKERQSQDEILNDVMSKFKDDDIDDNDEDANTPAGMEPLDLGNKDEDLDEDDEVDDEVNDEVDDEYEDLDKEFPEDDDQPKGFLTYDEWIEQGRDPEDFKGKNAYNQEYDRQRRDKDEIKDLRKDIKNVVASVGDLKSSYDTQAEKERANARVALNIQLEEAKDSHDVDAALEITNRIAELDKLDVKQKEPQQQEIRPAVVEFMAKNPLIDPDSSRFNKEFAEDMFRFQTVGLKKMSAVGDGSDLTDNQLMKVLNNGLIEAKRLNPDLFRSPKKKRPATNAKNKKRTKKSGPDHKTGLKGLGIPSDRQKDPAGDVYDMILKTRGKRAAESFAKRMMEK